MLLVILTDQLFIDPTFVCDPLQSFVVNVRTLGIHNLV